jgi:hypothetical protein
MKKTHARTLLTTSLAFAAIPATSSAVSIGLIDFEAGPTGFFAFAEVGGSIAAIHPTTGAGASVGVAARVNSDPGSYAGGGLSQFDLSLAGINGGSVTVEDFDTIAGSFDVNVPVGQSISFRLEPANGGYGQRVELDTVSGTGAFETIIFNAASASNGAQKTTLVNHLNGDSATGLKFIFQINNQSGSVGSDFVFDNIELTAGPIPEPSSFALGLAGMMMLLGRRKR